MRSKDTTLMHKIIDFVNEYYIDALHSPTTTEIANALGTVKSTVYRYLVDMGERGMVEYDGRDIETPLIRKYMSRTVKAGVLGTIACGAPEYAEENFEEYVDLPVSLFGSGDFFILRTKGLSMIEAGITPGDMVVVRKQNTASEGNIIVALVGNETTLKRYYIDKKKHCVRLHPENKDMEDILTRDCRIQGVAQHIIKAI